MKKIVIPISAILIIGFLALVFYGFRHSRGVPVNVEEPEKVVLAVPFIDKDIDLNKGVSLDVWDSIDPKEIELFHQVTVLPWSKSLVSPVTVKAFHNKRDIYFYLEWKDEAENRSTDVSKFSDACAVMFPIGESIEPSTIMMGFMGQSNIWHWKADVDKEYWTKVGPQTEAYADFYYPFEEKELFVVSKDVPTSAVTDLVAVRPSTVTTKETQNVQGRGSWNGGNWHVVFKRPIKAVNPEVDASFETGEKNPLCAFAIWSGENGGRGGRKSISDWVELKLSTD